MKSNIHRKHKFSSFIKNLKNKPVFILTSGLIILIGATVSITQIITFFKNNSDIKINYIDSKTSLSNDMEIIRFGVHNYSEDAKEITKANVYVLDYRDDNTNDFISYCATNQEGVSINIYNSGWSDLSNVSFSIPLDSDFCKNLKDSTKYNCAFSTLKHGQVYELGTLTINDLINKTEVFPIEIDCTISKDNSIYKSSCQYQYNSYLDKLIDPGKGGGTEKYDINYCIDTSKGIYVHELPVTYTCPKNEYEEIYFSLSANRSCHFRYSIEFYAQDKMIYKTEEKGVNIKINSRFGSPIKNTE